MDDTPESLRNQRDLLADALGKLLVGIGLTRADAPLTGPMLLLAAETAIEHLADEKLTDADQRDVKPDHDQLDFMQRLKAAVWMVGNMDTAEDKAAWLRTFEPVWKEVAADGKNVQAYANAMFAADHVKPERDPAPGTSS